MGQWKAPDGGETGLEEMRSSVLSEWLETCSLAFVPEGREVVVSRVAADDARERLAGLGIEYRVRLECVRHEGDRVVVRVPSGEEVALDRRDAWVLQVSPGRAQTVRAGVPAPVQGAGSRSPDGARRWLRGSSRRKR